MTDAEPAHGDPYCSNCGYALTGATESSKCPECGQPLVDVLMRPTMDLGGKRFRSKGRIFGMPIIDIAFGPHGREPTGKARGFIAIGNEARGVLAIGGQAVGVVAIGGLAIGGFSLGGLSIGLLTALGGMSIGGIAFGGWAMGGLARGGGAMGFVADGGMAIGYYARAGGAFGPHTIGPGRADPDATRVFDALSWLFGSLPPTVLSFGISFISMFLVTVGLAALIALIAFRASVAHRSGQNRAVAP